MELDYTLGKLVGVTKVAITSIESNLEKAGTTTLVQLLCYTVSYIMLIAMTLIEILKELREQKEI